MSEAVERLKPVLAALSDSERQELLVYLGSLTGNIELTEEQWEAEWAAEVQRRMEEVESGKVKMIPGEEVMSRLKDKYGT